ncbi:oxidoreductase [Citromicrobium sp. RCC1885]|uniref:SDR family oxidoreductase n=1 Tax=unclassified Citromicrobium TaxID=2630544 RepID=UPI0006C91E78|nr:MULTISPECIES: SDR family oxidoreductase [unclassified Citromicrobium]KPM24921.1 oxidoreductase [Citromicrobium sp. RCC1885]KPM28164.1 oxidoreductase [Citromicrobium sp. RCC1878]MAO03433.1 oxidoreductase [Citromicrobium sp.]OAM10317.1 oxidoreductase [Citromicrobium sp. RCC1897]|tara:strand:- start:416 stop:1177 length:762 start_codon:yes stop_codon:yes gene_type:complete
MSRPSVLITGGAQRLGAAFSRAFAEAGWHVVIHYRSSRDEAEALAGELPSAEIAQADFAQDGAANALAQDLSARLEDWRALVNSAAIFEQDSVTALDPAIHDRAMRTNARAPAMLAQSYLGHARASSGRHVIQVTDQKLANPNPDFFSYTMSKHALDATIRMLAMGATRREDRVYGLAPGAILASHDQSEEEAERSHLLNLRRRRTTAQDVAQAAVMLAGGDLANGETLFVDSGQHLLSQPRDVIYLEREGAR